MDEHFIDIIFLPVIVAKNLIYEHIKVSSYNSDKFSSVASRTAHCPFDRDSH